MYRIDNATAANALPTPSAVGPNPNGYFTPGNVGSGTPATIVNADWANAVQEELAYVIEQAGLTLSKTTRTQLLQAIEIISQKDIALYAASTTAANTYTATLSPAPAAYTTGMLALIKFSNHNTGAATINLNSLGAKSITLTDGTALSASDIADGMIAILSYDGTNFQLLNRSHTTVISGLKTGIQNNTYTYAASSTAANTYTATLSPAPTAYTAGMTAFIKFTNHNTGAATINLNSLGAISITRVDGSALTASDIADGMVAELSYDGTNFQLMNQSTITVVSGLKTDILNNAYTYAACTTSANTYTATLTPAAAAYTTGMGVILKFTNANTGAATINLNSLGAKTITKLSGAALASGDIQAGMMAALRYDGTNFQLLNPYIVSLPAAVQSDMETGTSTTVSVVPGVQKNHPGHPKAWVKFGGTGTIAVSYGITSVVKNTTGDYTITFSTAFSSADYCISSHAQSNAVFGYKSGGTLSTTAIQMINVVSNTNAAADIAIGCATFLGDQ